MKANKILLSGIAGTSVMTLFSYVASNYKNRNFKEPELLAVLLKEALPTKRVALPAGWSVHYAMGLAWASVFQLIFEKTRAKPGLKQGLVLGGLSGLTAVLVWRQSFKLNPQPPRINFKRFYGHLLLAHLVYSLTVTATSNKK